jgi:hypothetical protein
MDLKYRYKRFIIPVPAGVASYNSKFVLDKDVDFVRGLLVTADRPDLLFYRGTQKIEISGEEIFPEDYESRLLMSGVGVPPDQRFFTLADGRGIPAGNGEIKVLFKDSNLGNTVFAAYTLTLVLVCQIK